MKRYFLRVHGTDSWTEVSEERFIDAERAAGFYNRRGSGNATAYFSDGTIEGKVQYPGERDST